MFLDADDRSKIVDILVKSRLDLKNLPQIKQLKKEFKKALKSNGREFQDDIELEFFGACKSVIAQEVGKHTGISAEGIIYILDYMGLEDFKAYLTHGKFRKLKK